MRNYDLPVVINTTEYDLNLKYYSDLLKKLEDAFNNRTKTNIYIPTEDNYFTFRSRNTKNGYHLELKIQRHVGAFYEHRHFDYYMLTPIYGVNKPIRVKKLQVAGV
jgi:spermidine synthase